MIKIGSTTVTEIYNGGKLNPDIYIGSFKTYGENPVYIILRSTGGTISYGANYALISNISASTNSWTVESNSTSWLTVTKMSNTQARYTVTENDTIEERTGRLTFKIDGTTQATYTVRQTGQQPYIVLTPSEIWAIPYWQSAGTISVSSNTSNWVVSASTVPASEITGFTATKTNRSTISWSWNENTTNASRNGYANVSFNDVTAYATINQNPGYVLTLLGDHTRTIGNNQTSFTISIISTLGNNSATLSYSIGYNTFAVALGSVTEQGSTGQRNYTFTCNSNTATTTRNVSITFSQDVVGGKSTSVFITQEGAESAPSIPGFVKRAESGKWQIGTITASTTTMQGGTSVPVTGIFVVYPSAITGTHTAHITNMVYQYGPMTQTGAPTSVTVQNQDYEIADGAIFTASGTTYNGKVIVSPTPRLAINTITGFTVT